MTTSNSLLSSPHLRGPRLGLALALLVAATATSRVSHADPSAADLESARELFKEGREARQSGDMKRALERFKAAHQYGQTPVTALELGRTHIQLGELVEGREVLLSVARMKVQPDEGEKSSQARAEAAELAEDAKRRIPTLSVKLTGVAPDAAAQVTVDGFPVPIVSLVGIRKANPGKHVVVAKVGAREETRNVDLEESKTQELAIDLTGAASTATVAPPQGSGAPPADGERQISPVTWVGLGVGVLGVGIGSVFGIIALGKASDVNAACKSMHCPPATKDTVDSGRTAATVSTVGFAVGAAGVITAAVGYFVLSKPKASAVVVVRPFVAGTFAGVDGRF